MGPVAKKILSNTSVALFREHHLSLYSVLNWAGRPGSILDKGKKFVLLHSVKPSSGAHPDSYAMDTGSFFPGGKQLGREADHSPLPSVKAKNGGAMPPLPSTSSWRNA
jgi:hypothetical protein